MNFASTVFSSFLNPRATGPAGEHEEYASTYGAFKPTYYAKLATPKSNEEAQRLYNHSRTIAWYLDAIPSLNQAGLPFRIGVDDIISAFPVYGDLMGFVLSLYQVFLAWLFGVPRLILARMMINIIIDAVIGIVPVIGDFLDVLFKANLRNLELLENWLLNDAPHYQISIPPSDMFLPHVRPRQQRKEDPRTKSDHWKTWREIAEISGSGRRGDATILEYVLGEAWGNDAAKGEIQQWLAIALDDKDFPFDLLSEEDRKQYARFCVRFLLNVGRCNRQASTQYYRELVDFHRKRSKSEKRKPTRQRAKKSSKMGASQAADAEERADVADGPKVLTIPTEPAEPTPGPLIRALMTPLQSPAHQFSSVFQTDALIGYDPAEKEAPLPIVEAASHLALQESGARQGDGSIYSSRVNPYGSPNVPQLDVSPAEGTGGHDPCRLSPEPEEPWDGVHIPYHVIQLWQPGHNDCSTDTTRRDFTRTDTSGVESSATLVDSSNGSPSLATSALASTVVDFDAPSTPKQRKRQGKRAKAVRSLPVQHVPKTRSAKKMALTCTPTSLATLGKRGRRPIRAAKAEAIMRLVTTLPPVPSPARVLRSARSKTLVELPPTTSLQKRRREFPEAPIITAESHVQKKRRKSRASKTSSGPVLWDTVENPQDASINQDPPLIALITSSDDGPTNDAQSQRVYPTRSRVPPSGRARRETTARKRVSKRLVDLANVNTVEPSPSPSPLLSQDDLLGLSGNEDLDDAFCVASPEIVPSDIDIQVPPLPDPESILPAQYDESSTPDYTTSAIPPLVDGSLLGPTVP
ncbi:hypothetical protein FRB99_001436, partial [Tulasnella sp. 403]